MNNRKSRLAASLMCLVLCLSACGTAAPAAQPSQSGPQASASAPDSGKSATVIDAAGREVALPDKVERIAITCRGGSTNEAAIFGAADKIVGQPKQGAFPQLVGMYPQFAGLTDPGSFEDTNIEEVLKLQPDIVLAGITSPKANAKLEEAGLTVYTMQIGKATKDTILDEFTNMGKILNNQEQAEKLVAYWNETFAMLDQILSAIPQEERKTVYYTGKTIEAASSGEWGESWVEGSGGISALPAKFSGDVTVEQVMEWNPDVIVTQGGNGKDGLVNDARIQDMNAIRNKQVYECPVGAFWWDRPSPEAPLGFLWLAQLLYPEQMKDVDLKQETMDFYRTFYGYDLTEKEYQSFFYQ